MHRRVATWFQNLKIVNKIAIGMGLVGFLGLVIALTGILSTQFAYQSHRAYADASEEASLAVQLSVEMLELSHLQEILRLQTTSGDPEARVIGHEQISVQLDIITGILEALSAEKRGDIDTRDAKDEINTVQEIADLIDSYRNVGVEIYEVGLPARGDATSGLGGDILQPLNQINEQVDASEAISAANAYVLEFDSRAVTQYLLAMAEVRKRIDAADMDETEKAQLIGLANAASAGFDALLQHDLKLLEATDELQGYLASARTLIDTFVETEKEEQAEALDRLEQVQGTGRLIQLGVSAILLVLGAVFTVYFRRSITRPLLVLTETSRNIANGDYSARPNVTSTDEVGELATSFNTMVDAVERRERELERRANELRIATAKAREAARLKSEFLATMSHELRTPLNAIIGFSDMLMMGMVGDLNEKQHHKVERLRQNGVRLLNLVNDVLDLARIEAKRVEVFNKPFAPAALVDVLTKQMEVLAQEKGLAFGTTIDPDLPPTLIGDVKRIEQVVVNLLSNAFKFTDEGAVNLQVLANPAEKTWSISVQDTGVGIPPHAQDIIFEEFRQLDGSSTRAYRGTGLGLAITRNLVRMMEGHIKVESVQGEGSTFIVTLPLIEPALAVLHERGLQVVGGE